jgi:hypothetical protein
VPATVKLKEEYGSDLAVILVECQGADEAKFMKFAAGHKWLGREMMWTRERPFMTGAKGLPNYALLDETGTIVAMGNPMRDHGKITSEIDAAIARSKKGPKGLPKEAAKLRKLRVKGQWAKARAAMIKEEADAEGAVAVALGLEKEELERAFASQLARSEWLFENGYPQRALDLVEVLVKGSKRDDVLLGRLEPLAEKFEEAKGELAAAKALSRLERAFYEEGPDEKLSQRIGKMASKHEGTRVAIRAAVLAEWAAE